MEQKNRKFIVIAIVALIAAAMAASFGRYLFGLNTPRVVLPASSAGIGDGSGDISKADPYQRVEVTPQTVLGVIATLARPESYYRELTLETFWEGGSSSSQVQAWTDGSWSHIQQTLPSGVTRHDITDGDTLYYWYANSRLYQTAPADDRSSDLAQHIPTYETVLELDADDITDAGYVNRGGLSCIFVSVQPQDSELLQRYWISVDSGLLVSAETEKGNQVVYRMTAYSPIQSPCPTGGTFTLPDGTILHTVGE